MAAGVLMQSQVPDVWPHVSLALSCSLYRCLCDIEPARTFFLQQHCRGASCSRNARCLTSAALQSWRCSKTEAVRHGPGSVAPALSNQAGGSRPRAAWTQAGTSPAEPVTSRDAPSNGSQDLGVGLPMPDSHQPARPSVRQKPSQLAELDPGTSLPTLADQPYALFLPCKQMNECTYCTAPAQIVFICADVYLLVCRLQHQGGSACRLLRHCV